MQRIVHRTDNFKVEISDQPAERVFLLDWLDKVRPGARIVYATRDYRQIYRDARGHRINASQETRQAMDDACVLYDAGLIILTSRRRANHRVSG